MENIKIGDFVYSSKYGSLVIEEVESGEGGETYFCTDQDGEEYSLIENDFED